jgi:hypothetical protein
MFNQIRNALLICVILCFTQCAKEPFEPIDIFEEEEIPTVDANGHVVVDGENVLLDVGSLCDGVQLFANKERVWEVPGGFQIKGTLFASTEEGITSISSGDFEMNHNALDELDKFTGFGSMLMPDVGFFKDNMDLADLFGVNVKYGSGQAFKNKDKDVPLLDDHCYFQMALEESSGFVPGEPSYPVLIGNTALSFNTMYLQTDAPAILIKGGMDQYEVKDKPARVVEDANGKKKYKPASSSVKKKFSIKDVHIGLAAKPHFPFVPHRYSDELEEIVGGTGFEEFLGHLYLKGTIPLKKYPIDIIGEAVVKSDLSPLGPMDLFVNSFESSSYKMGINGTAEFGHTILDFLPVDTRVVLGKATVQLSVDHEETYLRMAGEYDDDVVLQKILGEELSALIPRYTHSGKLYANIGTKLSEWEYYFETEMGFYLPGIGEQKLNASIIHLTPNGIFLSCFATLPYGIGETEIVGKLQRDGTFLLSGRAKANLELGNVKMAADLFLEISNDGLFLKGMATLPGGISDFEIEGEISAQRIALSGSHRVNIDFGGGARLKTDLELEASSDTGVRLYGAMETPLDVTKIEVEGSLTPKGLLLRGLIKNRVDFGVASLRADLSLSASTWDGAKVSGYVDVPLDLIGGNIKVDGAITGITSFKLNAYAGVYIDVVVAAAVADVCFGFSQDDIKIGGSAGLCWDKEKAKETDPDERECDTLGLRVNPNWGKGTVSICVDIPVLGEHCVGE